MFGKKNKEKEELPILDESNESLNLDNLEYSEDDDTIELNEDSIKEESIVKDTIVDDELIIPHPNIIKYNHDMQIEERLSIAEQNIENIIKYFQNNNTGENKKE